MPEEEVARHFMDDPRFGDALLDFNMYFMGFKADDTQDRRRYNSHAFDFANAVSAAQALLKDGDYFKLFDLEGPFFMAPLRREPNPGEPTAAAGRRSDAAPAAPQGRRRGEGDPRPSLIAFGRRRRCRPTARSFAAELPISSARQDELDRASASRLRRCGDLRPHPRAGRLVCGRSIAFARAARRMRVKSKRTRRRQAAGDCRPDRVGPVHQRLSRRSSVRARRSTNRNRCSTSRPFDLSAFPTVNNMARVRLRAGIALAQLVDQLQPQARGLCAEALLLRRPDARRLRGPAGARRRRARLRHLLLCLPLQARSDGRLLPQLRRASSTTIRASSDDHLRRSRRARTAGDTSRPGARARASTASGTSAMSARRAGRTRTATARRWLICRGSSARRPSPSAA